MENAKNRLLESKIVFGGFVIDTPRRTLHYRTTPIHLHPREFDLLSMLVRRSGQPLEKQQIIDSVWPHDKVSDAALAQTVYRLRQALMTFDAQLDPIRTIPGRGYQFVVGVKAGHAVSYASNVHDDAFATYRRALIYKRATTEESITRAIDLLEDSLHVEPQYLPALVSMAEAYIRGARLHYIDARLAFKVAKRCAYDVLDLNPAMADAFAAWSMISLFCEKDPHAALNFGQSAVELSPQSAKAHSAAAWACIALGDFTRATIHAKEALWNDPSSRESAALLGAALYFRGRFDDACAASRDAIELDSDNHCAKHYLARSLCALGQYDEAAAILKSISLKPAYKATALQGFIAARAGDARGRDRALATLSGSPVPQYVSTAFVLMGGGHVQDSLAYIHCAEAARDPDLVFARCDPLFKL